MTTFVSYSRRQLYFAESLALNLQQQGVDIWFDLQQLQAGTVWADGLKDGVNLASRLILVVSKASLESPYTQQEWQAVVASGREIILVIFEPVDLPDELQGLVSFDFRSGFKKGLKQLVAFLKEGKKPLHDLIVTPSRFRKMPAALWAALLVVFAPLVACMIPLIDIALMPSQELPDTLGKTGQAYFYFFVAGWSLLAGLRYGAPLLRHKLEYKKLKQASLLSIVIQVPAFLAIRLMDFSDHSLLPLAGLFVFTLFFYLVTMRRSANLLRWMQPEEDLQKFRLAKHQPLVSKAKFNLDIATPQEGQPFTYTVHVDPIDQPFAKHLEQIFKQTGHTSVTEEQDPKHHIAILSNRSSQAWIQQLTKAHAGKLVCVVISTIEFKDSLKETGRYQWVDARAGDRRDISGLADSLAGGDLDQREAALEATPAMIDRWKVPSSITMQKRLVEIFAVFVVVFGLTELLSLVMPFFGDPTQETISNIPRSASLVVLGIVCFWLAGRAFVYRKIAPLPLYGFIVLAVVATSFFASLPWSPWFPQVIILPILVYYAMISRFWLPNSGKPNKDEIGIKKSIDQSFTKRSVLVMSFWVIGIISLAAAIQIKWGPIA
ncbi:MAG: hypothetical protein ACI9FR_002635 [Cryomorphaceae bacterium]|jgi:hypothetical protein